MPEAGGRSQHKQQVKDWMTPSPVTVPWNVSALEAYQQMKEQAIRRLPVMDGDLLVGIITESDIFRRVVEAGEQEADPAPQVSR